MSRKAKKNQRTSSENPMTSPQSSQSSGSSMQSSVTSMMNSTKEALGSVASTANNHRVLVGSILAGCGAGIALLATDSGRRIRSSVSDQIGTLYGQVSEQVSSKWEQLRSATQNMISGEDMIEDTDLDLEAERIQDRSRFAA
jgi:hypothetical protein